MFAKIIYTNMVFFQGKELIKSDLIGKSDPYAQIQYGNQKFKTKTVPNSQVYNSFTGWPRTI